MTKKVDSKKKEKSKVSPDKLAAQKKYLSNSNAALEKESK